VAGYRPSTIPKALATKAVDAYSEALRYDMALAFAPYDSGMSAQHWQTLEKYKNENIEVILLLDASLPSTVTARLARNNLERCVASRERIAALHFWLRSEKWTVDVESAGARKSYDIDLSGTIGRCHLAEGPSSSDLPTCPRSIATLPDAAVPKDGSIVDGSGNPDTAALVIDDVATSASTPVDAAARFSSPDGGGARSTLVPIATTVVGGTLLAIGSFYGISARDRVANAAADDALCHQPNYQCTERGTVEKSTARREAERATILMTAGGILAVGGLLWWWSPWKRGPDPNQAKVTIIPVLGGVGVVAGKTF
jgi:hypothetical protein